MIIVEGGQVDVKVTSREVYTIGEETEIEAAQKIRAILETSPKYSRAAFVWKGAEHPEGKAITHYFTVIENGAEREISIIKSERYKETELFIRDGNENIIISRHG